MKSNYDVLGNHIRLIDNRNKDLVTEQVLGINIDKYFMPSVANVIGTDLSKYKLISKGKGIELNMAGFKYGLGHPNPTEDILKRYKELGGEIITIGSDGHKPDQIAWEYKKVPLLLKQAGFDYYTIFKQRNPIFIKLDQ